MSPVMAHPVLVTITAYSKWLDYFHGVHKQEVVMCYYWVMSSQGAVS